MKPLRFPSTLAFAMCAARGSIACLVRPHGQTQAVDVSTATKSQVTDFVDPDARSRSGAEWGGLFVVRNFHEDALGKTPGVRLEYHGTDDQIETIQAFECSQKWRDEMGLSTPELFDHFAAVGASVARAWSENGFRVTTCFYSPLGVDSKLKVSRWRAGRIERTPSALPFEKENPMAQTTTRKPTGKPAPKPGTKPTGKPTGKPAPKSAPQEQVEDRFQEAIDAGLVEIVNFRILDEEKRRGLTVAFFQVRVAGALVTNDWRYCIGNKGSFVEGAQKARETDEGTIYDPINLTTTREAREALTALADTAYQEA